MYLCIKIETVHHMSNLIHSSIHPPLSVTYSPLSSINLSKHHPHIYPS